MVERIKKALKITNYNIALLHRANKIYCFFRKVYIAFMQVIPIRYRRIIYIIFQDTLIIHFI